MLPLESLGTNAIAITIKNVPCFAYLSKGQDSYLF